MKDAWRTATGKFSNESTLLAKAVLQRKKEMRIPALHTSSTCSFSIQFRQTIKQSMRCNTMGIVIMSDLFSFILQYLRETSVSEIRKERF